MDPNGYTCTRQFSEIYGFETCKLGEQVAYECFLLGNRSPALGQGGGHGLASCSGASAPTNAPAVLNVQPSTGQVVGYSWHWLIPGDLRRPRY